jgi:solute carrier family 7 (L-type amino acid transporter), member 5
MVPKAGGEYEYLGVAFGPLPAFLFVWSFMIILVPSSCALSAIIFADYILKPLYVGCDPPAEVRLLLAACSICK